LRFRGRRSNLISCRAAVESWRALAAISSHDDDDGGGRRNRERERGLASSSLITPQLLLELKSWAETLYCRVISWAEAELWVTPAISPRTLTLSYSLYGNMSFFTRVSDTFMHSQMMIKVIKNLYSYCRKNGGIIEWFRPPQLATMLISNSFKIRILLDCICGRRYLLS
jgi:hypothetical protein